MFYSDEGVNDLLHYSKTFVDEIAKKKEKSNDFLPEQYLIFAGMVSYYGFEHIDAIYKAFEKTGFVQDLEPNPVYSTKEENGVVRKVHAYCKVEIERGAQRYIINRNIHYLYDKDTSYGDFFVELLHEVNHCVNSAISPICKRNSIPVFRMGILISSISDSYSEAHILEEGFNTLQTEEIMHHILSFSEYQVEDTEMRDLLSHLRGWQELRSWQEQKYGRGYETVTPILYPLYMDTSFYPLLKENRLMGDLIEIRENFDKRVGRGAFIELADSIDTAWTKLDSNASAKANQLVLQYKR